MAKLKASTSKGGRLAVNTAIKASDDHSRMAKMPLQVAERRRSLMIDLAERR